MGLDDRHGTARRDLTAALAAVQEAPGIVEALRRIDDLVVAAAAADPAARTVTRLARATDGTDEVTAVAAVHAFGHLPRAAGQRALLALLASGRPHLREHAAWALGAGAPCPPAMALLVGMVEDGGFPGMLAQRTLERWAQRSADAVRAAIVRGLRSSAPSTRGVPAVASDSAARARLVESVGLVPGAATVDLLLALALHDAEPPAVRAAAVAALGDLGRADDALVVRSLEALSQDDGPLGDTARTAVYDLRPSRHTVARPPGRRTDPVGGTTIVQLFLHADIDAELSSAGRGDTGGIATLLVQLGDALVDGEGPTTRTVTVSRGRPADGTSGLDALDRAGHHYASVPLWDPPVHAAGAWPLRVAVRRGIRRILRAADPVDVVHLRMADVGSMGAAEAAADLGIHTVLTLAPDPHALVQAREEAGTLGRADFGAADVAEHLVFRDRLLRRLAVEAHHLVLFPRPSLPADVRTLLGVDLEDPGTRATVVGEGVDLAGIDRAEATLAAAGDPGAPPPRARTDLDALLGTLPATRRHLPVLLTVGRLHRVKGMATLVETWSGHPALAQSCNLLVVGGDLEWPTDDEAAELGRIHAAVPPADATRRGLLLAGHRPNAVVRVWMAATRHGRPGLAAPGGVYVSASLKEEFGIAIVEAMASGLPVVAPAAGGPATYVEDGLTGILVDTSRPDALATAVTRALAMAVDAEAGTHADAARARVRERFGIDAMAARLDTVYLDVAAAARRSARRRHLSYAGAGGTGR